MWLHFGMEKSEMAERVSKIVKILCGSFFVNSARFVGENNQFFCDSCGKSLCQFRETCLVILLQDAASKNNILGTNYGLSSCRIRFTYQSSR
jgi:hypothetical protein